MTTYKIGRGRGTKTVQARQYTRDQDWELAKWIDGPVRVYRDHFLVGAENARAAKGDWLIKETAKDGTTRVTVMDNRTFGLTARSTGEEI